MVILDLGLQEPALPAQSTRCGGVPGSADLTDKAPWLVLFHQEEKGKLTICTAVPTSEQRVPRMSRSSTPPHKALAMVLPESQALGVL